MSEKLEMCPFCSSAGRIATANRASCSKQGCSLYGVGIPIEDWNTRTDLAAAKLTLDTFKIERELMRPIKAALKRYKHALGQIKNLRFEYAIRKVVSSKIDKIADQALNPKEKDENPNTD